MKTFFYFNTCQWFVDELSTADEAEKLTALKFRGDLAFKRQDYQVTETVLLRSISDFLHFLTFAFLFRYLND